MCNFHSVINWDLHSTTFILLKTSKIFSYKFYVHETKRKSSLAYSLLGEDLSGLEDEQQAHVHTKSVDLAMISIRPTSTSPELLYLGI